MANTANQTNGKHKNPLQDTPSMERKEALRQQKRDPARPLNRIMPYLLIILALFFTVCILIPNHMGLLGQWITIGLYFLFGRACLLLPLFMVNLAIFWRKDRANGLILWKVTVSCLTMLLITGLLQLFYLDVKIGVTALAKLQTGAGVCGVYFGGFCHRMLDTVGTVLILGALLAVLLPFLVGSTPGEVIRYCYRSIRDRKRAKEAARLAQMQAQKMPTRTPPTQTPPAPPQKTQTTHPTKQPVVDIPLEPEPPQKQTPVPPVKPTAAGVKPVAPGEAGAYVAPDFDEEEKNREKHRSFFHRERFAPTSASDLPPELKKETADPAATHTAPPPTAAPYFPNAQADYSAVKEPSVPKMEPPAERTPNNWVEIKTADRFAPTSASDLPKDFPRSDAISHVRTVQLPPYQGDSYLKTQRVPVAEATVEDVDTFDAPNGDELLPPQHAVAEPPASHAANPMDYVAGKPVNVKEEEPAYHFDRPTPANVPTKPTAAQQAGNCAPPLPYTFPPTSLLQYYEPPDSGDVGAELEQNAQRLVQTLQNFRVGVQVTDMYRGPTVTRYELLPDVGVRVRNILNLADDIALSLASSGIRIEAPIPGKQAVGVEVPNRVVATVGLRELLEHDTFRSAKEPLLCALGADVAGAPVFANLAKMPHLLIAGATGTGKSVCINALVASLLFRASPDDVKLILVDPKKVELSVYNGLPHLLIPTVTDPRKAAGALRWATVEMDRRYQVFEDCHVRNMGEYNRLREENPNLEKLPMIVIIIDELADLMQTAPDDVEGAIARLTQLARAAGMHMIIGTQRPSVDVITGKIKSNVPSRIAFTVSSQIDSRTILDSAGAEKLIGRGDMLYAPIGSTKPMRVQGAYISESEVGAVVKFVQTHGRKAEYDNSVLESIERAAEELERGKKKDSMPMAEGDGDQISEDEVDLLKQCAGIAVGEGKISASYLQVKLKIGFQKAKRMICYMEQLGIIGEADGQKPREVLISEAEFQEMAMNDDAWANVQI